jgi:hypothetical protein
MEKRYRALRTIGTIYKVLAAIVAVITLLSILGLCATSILGGVGQAAFSRGSGAGVFGGLFGGVLGALIFSVVGIIYGGAVSLTLYAVGEGIDLLLALEENTRITAMLLQRQAGSPAPEPPPQTS